AREPEPQHDCAGGLVPLPGERRRDLAHRELRRAEGDAGDEREGEEGGEPGEPEEVDARRRRLGDWRGAGRIPGGGPGRRRLGHGSAGEWKASGWITPARCLAISATRGPGRWISSAST